MSIAAAPTVGFARLPAALSELLDEAAANAEAAIVALHALAEQPGRARALLAVIIERESDGDRITHDLRRELAGSLLLGFERADMLRLVEALDDVVDAIEETAQDLSRFADALPRERATTLAAVLRDLVRTSTRALRHLDERSDARAPARQRAHELRDELRRELRAAHVVVLDEGASALAAVRSETALARLRSVGDACSRLLTAIDQLPFDHLT